MKYSIYMDNSPITSYGFDRGKLAYINYSLTGEPVKLKLSTARLIVEQCSSIGNRLEKQRFKIIIKKNV